MTTKAPSNNLLNDAHALHERLRQWRRTIHRHPELSYTEERTAKLVQTALADLGIRFEGGVAKTGVVGHIQGDPAGPTVGLRADMDALPILEENGSEFDSERPGIMHACGHNAHTAMLLGAATLLKARADDGQLAGNIRLLFQPSEESWDDEGQSGGRRMVEEGALEGLDAVFGLHVDSKIEVGSAGTRPGKLLAAMDAFELTVHTEGAHATEPHKSADPIALAGLLVNAIHQVVSRQLDPVFHGVLTIGTINAGTATNIIPDRLTMTGTMRSMTPETRQRLRTELRRACSPVETFGASFELLIEEGYPVTVNDPAATEVAFETMRQLLGPDNALESRLIIGQRRLQLHGRGGAWMLRDGGREGSELGQGIPGPYADVQATRRGAAIRVFAAGGGGDELDKEIEVDKEIKEVRRRFGSPNLLPVLFLSIPPLDYLPGILWPTEVNSWPAGKPISTTTRTASSRSFLNSCGSPVSPACRSMRATSCGRASGWRRACSGSGSTMSRSFRPMGIRSSTAITCTRRVGLRC